MERTRLRTGGGTLDLSQGPIHRANNPALSSASATADETVHDFVRMADHTRYRATFGQASVTSHQSGLSEVVAVQSQSMRGKLQGKATTGTFLAVL